MADYNLNAEITADASGFESGIKKAEKASKKLSKSVSSMVQGLGKHGLVGALGAVGLATGGVSAILGTLTKVTKKVSETISECSEAYRKQYQAEIALATAVNNNPYVDGTATKRLKEFASEMQRVSDVGDEQLLPMMAQLVASGRTEEETMQIMSVALDMSASGAMSLDTAIAQLNATLNGNVGRLGQQNAELKDLTEEELKQGKAVEILGAKYKGLAQTTADSQKQLKNAIGDLKENLGQVFETALAPMRKYFTEVITNLNNSIKKSRELKGAMKEVFGGDDVNLEASTDALNIAFSEILHKQQEVTKNYRQYIQLYGKYIDEATDETAQSYKKQIAELNTQLKEISEELNKRKKASDEEKRKLEQAKAEEERQKELEELAKLNEKKLALQEEWENKLFAQRIEQLERARDNELENENLTEEQKKGIRQFYMQQIVTMKVAQLEKERDEILKNEELTEETRLAVQNYYSNKIQNVREDEAKKANEIVDKTLKHKKKKNEEEEKDEKSKFAIMLEYAKQYAQKIKSIISKVVSTIKSVVSGGVSLFQKLFEIDPDEILNNVLKIEDKILTFFVDTVPKMPSLISSIVESIAVLVGNISKTGNVKNLIVSILRIITDNLPQIINDTLAILEELIDGVIDGLIEWIDSDDGLARMLKLIVQIQKVLEKVVTKALTKLVDMLDKHKDDFSKFLADSMASANRTLPVLLNAILRLIGILIEAIANAFSDENFINSIIESIERSIDAIIEHIPRIITSIIKLIVNIISAIIPHLPELIMYVITEISKALPSMAGQIANSLSSGIGKIFKSIFTVDFWVNSLSSFGTVLAELVKSALTMGIGSWGRSSGSSGGGFDPLDIVDPVGIRHIFGFANGTNAVPKGLAMVGEAGPELVKFRGGEQVLNAHNTNKALAEMGGNTNNFNVTFNNLQDTTAFSMMQQLKQYNRQMAINGVI